MKLDKYYKIIQNTSQETKESIRFKMDILDRLHELLELKFGGKQKLLADKMGKSEAEISKLLSGIQNYTTKTLIKFQIAFGEPVVAVCTASENSTFVQVKVSPQISHTKLEIGCSGDLKEINTKYEDFKPANKIKGNLNTNLPV